MDNKLNNVRFQLDFGMIPKIFYKDPIDFVLRTRRVKGAYICALWNRYYEMLNPIHFPQNPKQFTPGDFTIREASPGKGRSYLTITLPEEHEGSLEYCKAYIIACRRGLWGVKNPRLFALERSPLGLLTLGAMEPDGTHTDLGSAGSEQENLEKIAKHAFDK